MFPIVTIDMAILASNNAIGYRKLCIYVKNVILERVSATEIPRTRKMATPEQRKLILATIEESYADLTSILGCYWQSIYVVCVATDQQKYLFFSPICSVSFLTLFRTVGRN